MLWGTCSELGHSMSHYESTFEPVGSAGDDAEIENHLGTLARRYWVSKSKGSVLLTAIEYTTVSQLYEGQ